MVVSNNTYLNLAQQQENALYISAWLRRRGWTANAVAGMLGNMETESTINPGLWQSMAVGWWDGGFGLVQWTPATKLKSWADDNGLDYQHIDTQLERIEWELANGQQWISTSGYPLSFMEFKFSNESVEYLAQAFLKNYERPKNQNQPNRSTQARYWYDFLEGNEGGVIPPEQQYQIAQFPMDMIYITQGENGTYSHMGTKCIDFVGTTDKYPYYAPCDIICRAVNPSPYHYVIWSTVNPVLCADGQVRHFTFSNIHENPVWATVGMTLNKGELMGHTGNGGPTSTGDHWHHQIIEGNEFLGFTTNSQGASTLVGSQLSIYDVYSVEGVNRVVDYGYDWKIQDGSSIILPPTEPGEPEPTSSFIPVWLLLRF